MMNERIRFLNTIWSRWFNCETEDDAIKEICLEADFSAIETMQMMTKEQYLEIIAEYNKNV